MDALLTVFFFVAAFAIASLAASAVTAVNRYRAVRRGLWRIRADSRVNPVQRRRL